MLGASSASASFEALIKKLMQLPTAVQYMEGTSQAAACKIIYGNDDWMPIEFTGFEALYNLEDVAA